MLRNHCAHCLPPEVSKVLQWSGGEIYSLLVSRVDPAASHPVSHRVQAIYTLVNIAAAGAFPPFVNSTTSIPTVLQCYAVLSAVASAHQVMGVPE